MSIYTDLSKPDCISLLQQYALGDYIHHEGIVAGTTNSNYFLYTSSGEYVITIFEKLSAQSLVFYQKLLTHLAAQSFPCAPLLPNQQGQSIVIYHHKPLGIMPRLAGTHVTQITTSDCHAVGSLLAQLHEKTQTLTEKKPNPFSARWYHQTAHEMRDDVSTQQGILLEKALRIYDNIPWETLPRGIIHADLFPDNVLFVEQTLTGVVDFYFACTDPFAFDVAIGVNAWCMPAQVLDVAGYHAMLGAYQHARAFSLMEQTHWPALLVAAGLRFWLSRLHAKRITKAEPHIQIHDPLMYEKIVAFHLNHQNSL